MTVCEYTRWIVCDAAGEELRTHYNATTARLHMRRLACDGQATTCRRIPADSRGAGRIVNLLKDEE